MLAGQQKLAGHVAEEKMACAAVEDHDNEASLLATGLGGCLEIADFGKGFILRLAAAVPSPITPPLPISYYHHHS